MALIKSNRIGSKGIKVKTKMIAGNKDKKKVKAIELALVVISSFNASL